MYVETSEAEPWVGRGADWTVLQAQGRNSQPVVSYLGIIGGFDLLTMPRVVPVYTVYLSPAAVGSLSCLVRVSVCVRDAGCRRWGPEAVLYNKAP